MYLYACVKYTFFSSKVETTDKIILSHLAHTDGLNAIYIQCHFEENIHVIKTPSFCSMQSLAMWYFNVKEKRTRKFIQAELQLTHVNVRSLMWMILYFFFVIEKNTTQRKRIASSIFNSYKLILLLSICSKYKKRFYLELAIYEFNKKSMDCVKQIIKVKKCVGVIKI